MDPALHRPDRHAEKAGDRLVVHGLEDVEMERLPQLRRELLEPSGEQVLLVVLESLCTGCPVLVSERLPVPAFDRPGILCVDPTNHHQIAAAVERGIRLDAPLTETAKLAQEQFSLSRMLDGYEELIESLIGQGQGTRGAGRTEGSTRRA